MALGIPPESISFSLSKRFPKIFRAKFRDLMKLAQLVDQIPADVWHIDWNVNCQAVSSSEASLKYLAPYVFKVAISNSRIVNVQNRTVLIRYRKPHSQRSRILALEVMEFIPACAEHGRQAPLLAACAAHRFYENPLLRFRCRFAPTRCRAPSSAQTALGSAVSQYFAPVGIRANSLNPIVIVLSFPVLDGSKGMRPGAPGLPIASLRRSVLRGNLRRKTLNLSKLYRYNFTWRRFTAPINLRFPWRKPRFTTITLILIAAASTTGFLNTGLKRLLKSSQSLLVRRHLLC